ncbi:hypothetical protein TNCV_2758421 [Trichonephila clavipes]|nr:hypothetical protein TNCV_2758421 [Trichonephila clavipes]
MEVHHTVTAGHTETARGIARVLDIPNLTVRKLLRSETTPTGPATCSVTGSRYAAMLKNYVLPELRRWNALNDIVWMQDGVPPHIARSVKRLLDQHFGDRIIPRYYPFRGLRDPQI